MNNEEKSRSVHPSIFLHTASGIFASLRLAYWQIITLVHSHDLCSFVFCLKSVDSLAYYLIGYRLCLFHQL